MAIIVISSFFMSLHPHKTCRNQQPQPLPMASLLPHWTLETGNTIAIQHDNNVVSFYKHNANLLKKVGDRVKLAEAIAIIGNTGEKIHRVRICILNCGKVENPSIHRSIFGFKVPPIGNWRT